MTGKVCSVLLTFEKFRGTCRVMSIRPREDGCGPPHGKPRGLERREFGTGSLMNVLNQKGTRPQDEPVRLGQLTAEDRHRMYARYPQLKILA
jgi:hypothetical protein